MIFWKKWFSGFEKESYYIFLKEKILWSLILSFLFFLSMLFQAKQQQRNGLVRPLPKTWSPKHIPVYQPNAQELNEVSSSDSDSEDSCWTLKILSISNQRGTSTNVIFQRLKKKKKKLTSLSLPSQQNIFSDWSFSFWTNFCAVLRTHFLH